MPVGFKKYVVSALAILTFLYLFTRHTSTAHGPSAIFASSSGAQKVDYANVPVHTGGSKADAGLNKAAEKPKSQKVIAPGPSRPLMDRLRFQYPYDPEGKFPNYIWQTWKATPASAAFGDKLRPLEASWTELNPTFIHEVITDDTAHHLIRYLYSSVPEVLEAYEAMPLPVLKADFFRYLILHARGGIYSDIDTEALKPAIKWLPSEVKASSIGLVVGIEADPDRPDWHDWYSRRIQLCQWTIQAKVGHPTLRAIIAQITEETLRRKREGFGTTEQLHANIIEYTGPGRWTDVIFDYMNDKDYFKIEDSATQNITWQNFTGMAKPKKVGDVVVLPITSFSPDVGTMGAGDRDDPMAFVKHDFEGSWKYESEHVKPVMGDIVAK